MLSLARLTPHASATLSRGLFARAAPASAPLWARLRAGSVGTAELTTASAAGAPAHIETLDAFEEALKGADGKLVIVDFTATYDRSSPPGLDLRTTARRRVSSARLARSLIVRALTPRARPSRWCGPCKMIGPYFDSLASEYAGRALFIKGEPQLPLPPPPPRRQRSACCRRARLSFRPRAPSATSRCAACAAVDVDANAETAADCGIRAMPTFQFYKNGGKVAEFAGADKAKLLSLITTHV
jgi:thiol-disulfide isomerase/thioredoxin